MRLYVFIILLLFSGSATGQDLARITRLRDSLSILKEDTFRVTALRQLGNLYYGIKADSAIYFTKKGLDLAGKLHWTKGIAQCALNLGNNFIYIAKYDSAVYYETRALEPAIALGDSNRIALIYINRGAAYTETHQYEKALSDISTAMRIAEQSGNKERQARASQSICELYMYQDKYDLALPWAEKALRLETELGDEMQQGVAEMSVGGLYSVKGKYAEAENFLSRALVRLDKTHRPDMTVECALSLSDVYLKTKRLAEASAILQKALITATQLHLPDRMAIVYASMGSVDMQAKAYASALSSYRKGYEIIEHDTAFQKNKYICLSGMAEANAALGDFKMAFGQLTASNLLKDSVLKKSQDEKMLSLQTGFETERKENEIQLLKKDKAINLAEIKRQRTATFGIILFAGMLLVIILFATGRYRATQKVKRLAEIAALRNNIASDLHDDIGSSLSSIHINSKIALRKTALPGFITDQLEKIRASAARTMDGMNDIVWAIHPDNDTLDKIIIRMKEFAAELLEPLNIEYRFAVVMEPKTTSIDISLRKDIYLVYKEAMNNAAKYSQCSSIVISIQQTKHLFELTVTDNGSGFDRAKVIPGNGLKNMEQRAEAVKGLLLVSSDKGTSVRLVIPITSTG